MTTKKAKKNTSEAELEVRHESPIQKPKGEGKEEKEGLQPLGPNDQGGFSKRQELTRASSVIRPVMLSTSVGGDSRG